MNGRQSCICGHIGSRHGWHRLNCAAVGCPCPRFTTTEDYESALYYCPTSGMTEHPTHGGFDICCDRPDLHRSVPRATNDHQPGRPRMSDEMVTVPLAALRDLVDAAWSDRWQVIGEFCVGAAEQEQAKRELREIVKALGVPQLEDDA